MNEEYRITPTNPDPKATRTRYKVTKHSKTGKQIGQAVIFTDRGGAERHVARQKAVNENKSEKIKWIKDKHGPGYTSHDGTREIIKHPKGWIEKSTTDRSDHSDVWPTRKEAMAGKYAWAMKNEEGAPVNVAANVANPNNKPLLKSPLKRFKTFIKQ